MDLRKRVLTFYGLALLCLLATIPLSLLYSQLMQIAAIGLAIFGGFMLFFSFGSTYSRVTVDLYEEDKMYSVFRYAGSMDPSAFGIVSGIFLMIAVAFTFTGIVDWEYLGLTFPNLFTLLWAIAGICALVGGIMARPLAKRDVKPREERKDLTYT